MQSQAQSQGKTFPSSETLDDGPSPTHNYQTSQKHISTHDEEVLTHISTRNHAQATIVLHELCDDIEFDYRLEEIVKCHRLYVCSYNLAVVSWRTKKFQEAEQFICQAISFLEMALNFCQYKQEHLVFSFEMIKLELQHCVVLSQNGMHGPATQICDQAVHRLFQCFKVKLLMTNQMILDLKRKNKHRKKNGIDFKNIVLKEAKEKLTYLCELQQTYQMTDSSEEDLHQIINKLYTWKTNLENNEKFIRMSLKIAQSGEHRNILGITKIPDWVDDFNIGTIMALNPLKMEFKPNFDTFLLLSSNKILQLVIYTSVAYFTVATEMRFKQLELDTKQLTSSQKILKMNDSSRILKCKVLHLRAIQLAGRFMPNSNQYISHLISSFNKNYKFYMEKIVHNINYLQDQENSYIFDSILHKKGKNSKSKHNSKSKSKPKSSKSKLKIASDRKSSSRAKDHSITQDKRKPKSEKLIKQKCSKSKKRRIKTDAFSKSRSKHSLSRHKNSVSNLSELKSSLTLRK